MAQDDDPLSIVGWIAVGDSPFGVEVLDCRVPVPRGTE